MNLNDVKEEVNSLLGQEVTIHVSGARNKKKFYRGIINNCYSNIFTVLIDDMNKSFSYADVAVGDVKIYPM